MSTTFNYELGNKPTRKSTYKIYLRITHDRKHTRIVSSIEVKNIKDFNPKAKQGNWIRTSEANYKVWNSVLETEIENARKVFRELKENGNITLDFFKRALTKSEKTPSFLEYARTRTTDILNEGGYRNYKKYNGFCNKLEKFILYNKKKDLLFDELNTPLIAQFENFLHAQRNERNSNAKLHPNTIAVILNIFKSIVNRSITVDKKISPEKNPFLGYKYDREKSSPKEKLDEEEIKKIEELELAEGTLLWHCRNYFLFSFYLAGIRAGDLIQLRWSNVTNEGRLEYRMSKNKKDRSILLHQKALKILKYYFKDTLKPSDFIFPLLDNNAPYAYADTFDKTITLSKEMVIKLYTDVGTKNSLINKYLKKIALKAGIAKNISMHISRHSFSKIAKDKKVDNNHLKNILGHSNIKITETYMGEFDHSETDKVMSQIFSVDIETQKDKDIRMLLEKYTPEQIEALLKISNEVSS